MNSDSQIKIAGGSALSYHAMVQTLVKKFITFDEFCIANGLLLHNSPSDNIKKLRDAWNKMASDLELCHSALGVITEAAEVADIIKSHVMYTNPLDHPALVKELGDVNFWVQDIQNKFFVSDCMVTEGNAEKLSERYKKLVYSDKQAIARVDKRYVVCAVGPDEQIVESSIRYEHLYEAVECFNNSTRTSGFNYAIFICKEDGSYELAEVTE
jgi:NTP pyrophosphatase (non-canonical NTP hydrolase)